MKDREKEIRQLLLNVGFSSKEIDEYLKTIKKEAKIDPLFVRD